MLYISPEDFFRQAAACPRLCPEAQTACAGRMRNGDEAARQQLRNHYLPMVAGCIRRLRPQYQTLSLVYTCVQALEHALDRFDFTQTGETFAHYLSRCLRQCTTAHIANYRT